MLAEAGVKLPTMTALGLPDPSVDPVSDAGTVDILLGFVVTRAGLQTEMGSWAEIIHADGAIWVCWPKKAARKIVPSDMTEDFVREVALPMGLVDVKVCAVDGVWSGLRLCWRVELRAARRR